MWPQLPIVTSENKVTKVFRPRVSGVRLGARVGEAGNVGQAGLRNQAANRLQHATYRTLGDRDWRQDGLGDSDDGLDARHDGLHPIDDAENAGRQLIDLGDGGSGTRTGCSSRCSTSGSPQCTVIAGRAASRSAVDALHASGVEVIVVTGENEHSRVRAALSELGQRGVSSLMFEGGSHLAGAFFDAGEIDELRMFVAPMLLGGRTAPSLIGGEGVERIADAVRPVHISRQPVGDDLLTIARLKEW